MMPVSIGYGRGWLDQSAAASVTRIDAELGRPLDVNSAGRTWQEQYEAWLRYQAGTGSFALHPDNPLARHTKGLAVDTDDRIGWIGSHGWVADVSGEPWHFEYRAWLDQYIGQGAGGGSVPFKGGFLMALSDAQQAQVYDALVKHSPGGDYYMPDALINELRNEVIPRLDGLVARADATNTRLTALAAEVEKLQK